MMKCFLLKREFFISNHEVDIKQHYDFIKELGRGSYGTVYLAKQKVFPYNVRVVKRISKRRIKNPKSVINEIKITGSLDHPHIVKLYQTFQDSSNLFLILDYCEGGQLYTRLSHVNNFTEDKAKHLFKQMVNALRYMHYQKIAHRDLKLQNFLMKNDSSWQLMLIDFGLSFQWTKDMRSQLVEQKEHKIVGTAYYIAPQVLTFDYDQKCDIWSLGVILYMMVTGSPPFDGEKDSDIMNNIAKINYSLKIPQCQNLTPALIDLIQRILQPSSMRISLNGILSHPWLIETAPNKILPIRLKFQSIKNFSTFTKLKKIVATYIASNLSQSEIEHLRVLFEQIDVNHDGYITLQELRQFLYQKQSENIPIEQLQKIMKSIDTDRNGKINYNEFVTSCLDELFITNQKYLHYAFCSFDLNRDGKIQRQQFKVILKAYTMDFKCNQQLVEALIAQNDKDQDGVIDFNQFMCSLKTIRQFSEVSECHIDTNMIAE